MYRGCLLYNCLIAHSLTHSRHTIIPLHSIVSPSLHPSIQRSSLQVQSHRNQHPHSHFPAVPGLLIPIPTIPTTDNITAPSPPAPPTPLQTNKNKKIKTQLPTTHPCIETQIVHPIPTPKRRPNIRPRTILVYQYISDPSITLGVCMTVIFLL
jgi:hypothetical protein